MAAPKISVGFLHLRRYVIHSKIDRMWFIYFTPLKKFLNCCVSLTDAIRRLKQPEPHEMFKKCCCEHLFFKICNGHCCQTQAVKCQFKVKWPPALYDFDKSRPSGRALHLRTTNPVWSKTVCWIVRKRRFRTGFLGPILRQTSLNEQN